MDRQIVISAAGSRHAEKWPKQQMWWSEFIEKVRNPVRSLETLAEFLKMPKSKQDALKDVGGYVGGSLKDDRRLSKNVITRDLITLDLDNIPASSTKEVLKKLALLGCAYVVYSTRKHEEARPRLRVVIPSNRSVTAEEYEPIARKLAELITLEWADPTTFQASRLMYWPSCSRDSKYVFHFENKPFLDADAMLKLYRDWHDHSEWPRLAHEVDNAKKLVDKQQDPETKSGIVGAFCKTYDIYSAIESFLPGTYLSTEIEDRLTFSGGSTFAGAIVYDGKFLYSHHATDPASQKLCNAWDLVRLHKFGDLDEDVRPNTPANKLPSFVAMSEFAIKDEAVTTLLNKERYDKAVEDFDIKAEDLDWIKLLKVSSLTGTPEKTIDNTLIILENDPLLKGKIAFDEFANRGMCLGALPWNKKEERREWKDDDDAGLRHYIEKVYSISGKERVYDATTLCAMRNKYNDVKDYIIINLPVWDGVSRLETLFINYLGAEDSIYARTITRKSFVAAVARILEPGVKYDYMPILTGRQGLGKSSFFSILGGRWFSDSLSTFEGKEASESIQGVWIVEVGELTGLSKSETNAAKQFISKRSDRYREPYGKRTVDYPRRCVFFGTTNESEFLRDSTGNRRFWPIDVGVYPATKNIFEDLQKERDQIWAEALWLYRLGEKLFLPHEIEKLAIEQQEKHMESTGKEGTIIEFMLREVPADWSAYTLDQRKAFWAFDHKEFKGVMVKRDRICAAEVWTECFGKDMGSLRKYESIEINNILRGLKYVEKTKNDGRYGCHGKQKGFRVYDKFFEVYTEI